RDHVVRDAQFLQQRMRDLRAAVGRMEKGDGSGGHGEAPGRDVRLVCPGAAVRVVSAGLVASLRFLHAGACPATTACRRTVGTCRASGDNGCPFACKRVAMKPVSLTQFLIEERRAGYGNAELGQLIEVVARACKRISVATGKGALGGVLGEAGTDNVQGEAQKKLDVLSNEILLEANAWGGHLAACASEEMEDPQRIAEAYPKGGYLLLFDPLDGSSNIDVDISVGTIFSVLKRPRGNDEAVSVDEFLQAGAEQVAAGYVVYGPSTLLVLTIGHGTHVFTLDREVGSFRMT